MYCIAYNSYCLQEQPYQQSKDPWSAYFQGYCKKGVYCKVYQDRFVYQGVWRNFMQALEEAREQIVIRVKTTEVVLSPADYMRLTNLVLFKEEDIKY